MNYSPDAFLALMEQVEDQGGIHLKDRCVPRRYVLPREGSDGKKRNRTYFTTGCNADARFLVPYDGENGPRSAVVCAVDDEMGKWPRFQNEVV